MMYKRVRKDERILRGGDNVSSSVLVLCFFSENMDIPLIPCAWA